MKLKTKFSCPHCCVISTGEFPVQTDNERKEENIKELARCEAEKACREKQKKELEEKWEGAKEKLMLEYLAKEDRNIFDKLMGIESYQYYHTFNSFLVHCHENMWNLKWDVERGSLHPHLVFPHTRPEKYIECPHCKDRHWFL